MIHSDGCNCVHLMHKMQSNKKKNEYFITGFFFFFVFASAIRCSRLKVIGIGQATHDVCKCMRVSHVLLHLHMIAPRACSIAHLCTRRPGGWIALVRFQGAGAICALHILLLNRMGKFDMKRFEEGIDQLLWGGQRQVLSRTDTRIQTQQALLCWRAYTINERLLHNYNIDFTSFKWIIMPSPTPSAYNAMQIWMQRCHKRVQFELHCVHS